MTKKRAHRWGGAGYVCADCGAIQDTRDGGGQDSCAGTGKTGFDIWLYHAGAGWWLDEFEVTTIKQATAILGRKIGNTVAGAIVPAGQPLGLFTKRHGA